MVICAGSVMGSDEFDIAEQAFEKGYYTVAEAFFRAVIEEVPDNTNVPDALYFLTRIYRVKGEFVNYMDAVNHFLQRFEYDQRCAELAYDLMDHLCDQQSYHIAYHYAREYDHLIIDTDLLCRMGLGLYRQDELEMAVQVLAQCPPEDTVLILRATLTDDRTEQYRLYEHVSGIKGTMYTIEALLDEGDTIAAFGYYRTIGQDIEEGGLLYRYARVSLLFDRENLNLSSNKLSLLPGFETKAQYLQALVSGNKEVCSILPDDAEENRLYRLCLQTKVYDPVTPESVAVNSMLPDSFGLSDLEDLRAAYPGVFSLDSLYCEQLLRVGRAEKAFASIEPYLYYVNTHHYARFIRGLLQYNRSDYSGAVKDILLSQNTQIRAYYVLARAMVHCGLDPLEYYEIVLDGSIDSVFRVQVQQETMVILYQKKLYQKIVSYPYEIVIENDSLHRLYLNSLAHTGNVKKADSLARVYFGKVEPVQADHYGIYLVANKAYNTARFLYDSLYNDVDEPLLPSIQYTWALVPMLQGDVDTALYRFKRILERVQPGSPYYRAAFKCASIHYIKEEFDSAAHYYGIAKIDDSLRVDALQNQMICYKKAAEWRGVMQAAEELIPSIDDSLAAETYFEYGYAQLRYGDLREAIDNFHNALQRESSPGYLFWLAETYLAKGNFIKALYHYRKIMELYPGDEMWTPTAWYKVGIALEFMDELDEAKSVYQGIIEQRGAGDTWSIEAQKRMDLLK